MNKIIPILLIMFFSSSMIQANTLVSIGDETFTKTDLKKYFDEGNDDPMDAVNKIKFLKMAKKMAIKRELNISNPKSSLYSSLFNHTYEDDMAKLKTKGIAFETRQKARQRSVIFENIIATIYSNVIISITIIKPN